MPNAHEHEMSMISLHVSNLMRLATAEPTPALAVEESPTRGIAYEMKAIAAPQEEQ